MKMRFAGATVLAALIGVATAQPPAGFNVIPAPPRVNVQDKEDVWVLDFQFKSPRVITVDVPGRGRKTVWYVRYEVWNRTGAPRFFIPGCARAADDRVFHDEFLPSVQDRIAKIEDPTGFYDV